MQTYDLINKLKGDGTLSQLVRAGLLAPKVVTYAAIFERVEYQQKRRKRISRKNIILLVADEYRVHPTTVYRAIGLMKQVLTNCEAMQKKESPNPYI